MNLREAPRRLVTTRWSMIARAAAPSQDQQQALGELCRLYWFPLYSFARRAGHSPEDAADVTQEFLASFLERRDLEKTSPERGRFRSYLLQAMRNFLTNEWRKQRAQKRGAAGLPIEIDVPGAEARYAADPGASAAEAAGRADLADPERLYLRSFAMTAVSHALRALEDECRDAGHHALFVALQPALVGELEAGDLERLASPLGRSAGALKVALHRLRVSFRDHVRAQIVDLVANEAEADDEIRAFLAAL
jgi:RNA polymerase sigma factor (sigma-70 family)